MSSKSIQPEALMQLADAYAEALFDQGLHRRAVDDVPENARSVLEAAVRNQHSHIEELEAQLEALGSIDLNAQSTIAMWQEAYQHVDAKLDALEALTKRLALDLECVLLNRDKWWDQAHESLQAYRDLMDAWYPQEHVSPLGKD